MTHRALVSSVLAAALAATLLAGCSPDEDPTTDPTTAAPTSSAPETTEAASPSEQEIRAQFAEDGFAAVEDYVFTYYLIANGGYEDEGLIAQWLDTLGPNWRETMRANHIEPAQAQDWKIEGTPTLEFLEMTDYEETADYTHAVIRICEDRSETVPYVGDEAGTDDATIMEYTVFAPADGGTPKIDNQYNTKEPCG